MSLIERNIYTVPVHYVRADTWLVYAPLADAMFLADDAMVDRLKAAASGVRTDPEALEVLEVLSDGEQRPTRCVCTPEEYRVLYVLPNYICNFACSYCFSAKGRSNKEISRDHLQAALDYFVTQGRGGGGSLKICFAGGGEPMMSWEIVKLGLEYASTLARERDVELFFTLITNGSIIDEEIVDTLVRYGVAPRVSFEVLEEVQNSQRGQYDEVCLTIDRLLAAGVKCEVRSMITPLNVDRMPKMVNRLAERFPEIESYCFDPITDAALFCNVETTRNFYDIYNRSFLEARTLAAGHGKELKNGVTRGLEDTVERYCNGEMCLTPEGTLSACLEISSPTERDYRANIYGRVDEAGVMRVDVEKFERLIQGDMAVLNPKCSHCFVRWNWGGGCGANNRHYTPEVLDAICDATRELSLKLLLERLNEFE
jgi:radical SAM protein with 4Fe4S-binding SPASM domain